MVNLPIFKDKVRGYVQEADDDDCGGVILKGKEKREESVPVIHTASANLMHP